MNDNTTDIGAVIAKRKETAARSALIPLNNAIAEITAGRIPEGARVYVAIGFDKDGPRGKEMVLWRASINNGNRMELMGFLDIHHNAILTGTL